MIQVTYNVKSSWTPQPLNMKTLCSLKIKRTTLTKTQHHITQDFEPLQNCFENPNLSRRSKIFGLVLYTSHHPVLLPMVNRLRGLPLSYCVIEQTMTLFNIKTLSLIFLPWLSSKTAQWRWRFGFFVWWIVQARSYTLRILSIRSPFKPSRKRMN